MNNQSPIKEFLMSHAKKKPVSFHMPGHKGSEIYRRLGYEEFLTNMVDCDVTEIPGADNLFQTEGIIKGVQDKYARLYDVKKSYLLINGTSGGIIASILASVPKGKKIIMARNCHKSVFNALTLGSITPIYAYPEIIEEYGISGQIRAEEIEKLLKENQDAEAVILPSPNYYGICSDIAEIAKIVHSRGKVLIVDQAHGAHLKFFSQYKVSNLPKSAEELGADLVVNSIHKTLASFTQSAVLNFNSDRVDRYVLEDKLQAIQSTSPSYLLMASLDINGTMLEHHGAELIRQWNENLDYFYREAALIKELKVMDLIENLDKTKINLNMSALGLSGGEMEILLMEYGIYSELITGNILMCMSGIGNTRQDFEKLIRALNEIASSRHSRPRQGRADQKENTQTPTCMFEKSELFKIPDIKLRIPLAESEGFVCSSSVIPYPPGIPLVCPGEKFTGEVIRYIQFLREHDEKVIGVNDLGEVFVGVK